MTEAVLLLLTEFSHGFTRFLDHKDRIVAKTTFSVAFVCNVAFHRFADGENAVRGGYQGKGTDKPCTPLLCLFQMREVFQQPFVALSAR
ncbi:hypothetical protein SDC9_87856 [bioreactor metagenome]|uniref:Uncharacterized protein n=1 Tax=bioreactor metagenome TaxID=1076179 RepID=A0A644ZK01_9ZZZZ